MSCTHHKHSAYCLAVREGNKKRKVCDMSVKTMKEQVLMTVKYTECDRCGKTARHTKKGRKPAGFYHLSLKIEPSNGASDPITQIVELCEDCKIKVAEAWRDYSLSFPERLLERMKIGEEVPKEGYADPVEIHEALEHIRQYATDCATGCNDRSEETIGWHRGGWEWVARRAGIVLGKVSD